jgi:NAD(P)-dependent dehydrogenase (short-subunit alcohol dehydrogenase family)
MANKNAIIVGVGPGLGLSLAKKFGRKGFSVAMIARRKEALDQYCKILQKEGLKATGHPANVGDFGSLSSAIRSIVEEVGNPTILIYNVSILNPGSPTGIDPAGFVGDFKVNVAGLLVAIQSVLPSLKQSEDPMIMVTGGGLALKPFHEYASLSVGKAGIRSLTGSLAQELKPEGVRVGTIIINGMIEKGTHFDPDLISEEFWKMYQDEGRKQEREFIYN